MHLPEVASPPVENICSTGAVDAGVHSRSKATLQRRYIFCSRVVSFDRMTTLTMLTITQSYQAYTIIFFILSLGLPTVAMIYDQMSTIMRVHA